MADTTSNTVVVVPALVLAKLDALGAGAARISGEGAADWQTVGLYVWPEGAAELEWSKAAHEVRLAYCKARFLGAYLKADGTKAASKADVKAAKATTAEAEAYAKVKARGQAWFGMGIKRAFDDRGLTRPTVPRGNTASVAEAPAAAPNNGLAKIDAPSFLRDLQAVQEAVAAFQTAFGARLSKPGKDSIGVIGEMVGKLVGTLTGATVADDAAKALENAMPKPPAQ